MYQYKCKIIKVLDGDTVDIDLDLGFKIILANQRVRMAGVDTPESRTTIAEEKVRGLLSKKKLAEKLPIGSWQIIETQKPLPVRRNNLETRQPSRVYAQRALQQLWGCSLRGECSCRNRGLQHRGRMLASSFCLWCCHRPIGCH